MQAYLCFKHLRRLCVGGVAFFCVSQCCAGIFEDFGDAGAWADKALLVTLPVAVVGLTCVAIAAIAKIDKVRMSKYFYTNKDIDGKMLPNGALRLVFDPLEARKIRRKLLFKWSMVLTAYSAAALLASVTTAVWGSLITSVDA